MKSLSLSRAHLDEMQAHVSSCLPLEACGLLAGRTAVVQRVLPVLNLAASPVRFRMDPQEQLRALNWIDENALDLLGIFHSHPAGPQAPSATDIAESSYAVVQVIWWQTNGAWEVGAFWIEAGRSSAVELTLVDHQ